jgi:hypothetical protein
MATQGESKNHGRMGIRLDYGTFALRFWARLADATDTNQTESEKDVRSEYTECGHPIHAETDRRRQR